MTTKRSLIPFFFFLLLISCNNEPSTPKVLIFTKTVGFVHESIQTGVSTLDSLLQSQSLEIVHSDNSSIFSEEKLREFSTIVFLNTTGDILNESQQSAMERFVQAGGGFVGIHSATDTEYDWPWYNQLVGAYFQSHPHIQTATLQVANREHSSVKHLNSEWIIEDEWYNFRDIQDHIEPILMLDESSYKGGENGDYHPFSWSHTFDGGKVFYTGLGHRKETWSNPDFQQHVLDGILSVMPTDPLRYEAASSTYIPPYNRFKREVLVEFLNEPMEMDIIENDIMLIAERKGDLKAVDLRSHEVNIIHTFDVYQEFEEGLIGMALDPNFRENSHIYVFHSLLDTAAIQLSRFTLSLQDLSLSDQKEIIRVPVQREECCHVGGSVEFGPDGLLYISVGDNTNPFESAGFSPSDERPGRSAWDAQKSSANTNDLRGKILRIKPLPEGGYEIPEGNLFPLGMEKTRPEIYTMGLRNPFRISIDQKRNWLFWGDVGPDAGEGRDNRGPKGIDEINLAKQAGNWGWPYTRGNNQPYRDFNFATNESGPSFDPVQLINNSPHNTGLEALPPAQKSLIWYSYDRSEEFPWTGRGGKNPMAGPVFYSGEAYDAQKGLPLYYEGKLFVYEWMRDWIFSIELDESGNYVEAVPFLKEEEFHNPIDMLIASNGEMYILEYGEKWYGHNPDARLNRISFEAENRKPIVALNASQTMGGIPLTVQFSGSDSYDPDGDKLTYEWQFTGEKIEGTKPQMKFEFTEPGIYEAKLTVKDEMGNSSSKFIHIYAGNEIPRVDIEILAGSRVYRDNMVVDYAVHIEDKEDGTSSEANLPGNFSVDFNYLAEGEDLAVLGHQSNQTQAGKKIIASSDCAACHHETQEINGPSYAMIARKYDVKDMGYLTRKIRNGGSGVWGERAMAPHPDINEEEAESIINYILSLQAETESNQTLGLTGKLSFTDHLSAPGGKYVLRARYEDAGNGTLPSQTAEKYIYFFPPKREAETADFLSDGIAPWEVGGTNLLGSMLDSRYFVLNDVDLKEFSQCVIKAYYSPNYAYGGTMEVRMGSIDGEVLGSLTIDHDQPKPVTTEHIISISQQNAVTDLYFVCKNETDEDQYFANIDWVEFKK